MSDSLRDQLLQAGFAQTRSNPPSKKQRPQNNNKSNNKKSNRNNNSKPGSANPARPQQNQAANQAGNNTRNSGVNAARQKTSVAAPDEAAIARKAIKAEIKTLIEADAIKEYAGESAYRFTLQNRIRELHVSEPIRKQLVANELVITRLNGKTYLVPEQTAQAIHKLNPDWAIVTPKDETTESTDGYDDFPVPDDIVW